MQRKVQILTFARGDNYGAVLQSYGLAEVLRRMGYDVEFLSLTKRATWRYKIISNLSPLKRGFENFRKKYLRKFTKPSLSEDELRKVSADAACCIVGSDQVWNPSITSVRTPLYFFSFLPKDKPRISYAASFGTETWNYPEIIPMVKEYLDRFTAVSVREDTGVKICKDTFCVDATQVLDPTLLLGDFKDLLVKPKYKDSIVGFNFNPTKDYYMSLKKISDLLNAKVLVMDLPSRKMSAGMLSFRMSPFSSVEQWVTNIANAKVVVTDSFHCLAFSILFHREFFYIAKNKKLLTRVTSLLSALDLSDRIFQSTEDFNKFLDSGGLEKISKIDYEVVDKKLDKMRRHSKDFLMNSLPKL